MDNTLIHEFVEECLAKDDTSFSNGKYIEWLEISLKEARDEIVDVYEGIENG